MMLPLNPLAPRAGTLVLSICLLALLSMNQIGFAQDGEPAAPPPVPVEVDDEAIESLTRGALHEAFADQVSQDLVAGVVAPVAPPEPIDELPPEIKPEGDDIEWLPGYWYWEEERGDYIWISGVWRKVPPGRRWVPGYWTEVDGKYRRVSGMWDAAAVAELEYLPYPPDSLERGPVSPAPSDDYFWSPGCWVYRHGGYSWRPGYWERYRNNWVWMPTRYVWSPNGCLYQAGYWDYPFASRGQLYSPVYFHNHIYQRPNFCYQPSFTISTNSIFLHLFVRRGHSHYYFGDYYSNQHRHHYHPWYNYHHVGRRYDPLITHAHGRSHHTGVDYVKRLRDWNHYFTRHADHRPPATIRHQREFEHRHKNFAQLNHVALGRSIKQTLHDQDSHIRSHRTSTDQQVHLRKRIEEVRQLADARRNHESHKLSQKQTDRDRGDRLGDRRGDAGRQGPGRTAAEIRDRLSLAGKEDDGRGDRSKRGRTDRDVRTPNAKQPNVTVPGATKPDTNAPEIAGPLRTRPEKNRPEKNRPENTGPVNTGPDKTGPLKTRPDKTGPEIAQPERTRPGSPNTGSPKPDIAKQGRNEPLKRTDDGPSPGLETQNPRARGGWSFADRNRTSDDQGRNGGSSDDRFGRGRINRTTTARPQQDTTNNTARNTASAGRNSGAQDTAAANAAAAAANAQHNADRIRQAAEARARSRASNSSTRQQSVNPTTRPSVRDTLPTPRPSVRNTQPTTPSPLKSLNRPTPSTTQPARPAQPSVSERVQAAREQFRAQYESRTRSNPSTSPSIVPSNPGRTQPSPVGPRRPTTIPKPSNPTFGRSTTPALSTPRAAPSPAPSWSRSRSTTAAQPRATFSQPRPAPSPRAPVAQPKPSVAQPRASFQRPQAKPSFQNRAAVGPQKSGFSNGFRGNGRKKPGDN